MPWWPKISKIKNKNNQENDQQQIYFPSTVWTTQLRYGFIGCLKNLRINGINAQIANVFEAQKNNLTLKKNETLNKNLIKGKIFFCFLLSKFFF